MLRPQFKEEPVQVLKSVSGRVSAGPGLPKEQTTWFEPDGTHQGYVQPLGVEETVRLGLRADVARFRVRLPAGVMLKPGDHLQLRSAEWKAVLVTAYTSYTRVIVEGF